MIQQKCFFEQNFYYQNICFPIFAKKKLISEIFNLTFSPEKEILFKNFS